MKIDIGTPTYLQPPTFASPDEQRREFKLKLAAALRIFARFGFNEGIAGHLTVRDPERRDHFWVNPFGLNFALATVDDLVLVGPGGQVVEGIGPVNSAAFAIHASIHAARPDVVAAAHAHSVNGKAWSALGQLLDPITQDSCAFYEDHALYETFSGIVLDPAEGDRIAKTLGHRKAVILQNHGLLTVGSTIDEAAFWFIAMDNVCHVQILAQAAGKVKLIDHDQAVETRGMVGNAIEGWTQFQPLYRWICQVEPDFGPIPTAPTALTA
jgi:ribulose-5-phosphate 4-epimerase/fuculose-1-phosphate aldolase